MNGCQEAGHAIHASPSFYRLSKVVSGTSAWTFSLPWHAAKTLLSSLSPSQTYNILSPPSSSSSSLIYMLIHRQRDLLRWQHSHFFTLCAILLWLTFTEAQQVLRYSAEHFIYNPTELPFRLFFSLWGQTFLCVLLLEKHFHHKHTTLATFFLCLSTHSSPRSDLAMSFYLKKPPKNTLTKAAWKTATEQLVKPPIYFSTPLDNFNSHKTSQQWCYHQQTDELLWQSRTDASSDYFFSSVEVGQGVLLLCCYYTKMCLRWSHCTFGLISDESQWTNC